MALAAPDGMLRRRPMSLSSRLARLGAVIVLLFALIALLTPVLVSLGVLSDPSQGLDNPIHAAPSWWIHPARVPVAIAWIAPECDRS